MSFLRLKIPAKAIDAYLYGGYLFLFMQDGSMRFCRFDNLLWKAANNDVSTKNLLKLVFLPHQYLKGSSYKFLYSLPMIREMIESVQRQCILENEICLDEHNIEEDFTSFGELGDLPFDVCIYGGELFIASDSGVHHSSLNAYDKYNISPKRLKKIFDCTAVSLTAKAAMLAVSAKEDGLFSHRLFSDKKRFINDRPAYEGMSINANWSDSYSLINYSDLTHFMLLENNVEVKKQDALRQLPFNYRKDLKETRFITEIGTKEVKMSSLMEDTKLSTEELIFSFNTQTSGFFFLKDGSLQVRNMRSENNSFRYSSKTVFNSNISEELGRLRPISAIAVPNGCMIETYDKVFLIKGNKIQLLADECVYGIRSFLSSNNYRNLVSIVFNDHVEILAFPQLPTPSKTSDRSFRPGYLKEPSEDNNMVNTDDLPF